MANKEVIEFLQKKLQEEEKALLAIHKQRRKILAACHLLNTQLNENELTKEELDSAEEDTKVYKLIGPMLLALDVNDASGNVDKRISYITGELKKNRASMVELDKKQEKHEEDYRTLQFQIQKLGQA